jgi:dihydrofolate reductase
MGIFKSIPSKRIINGIMIETSDSVIVSNTNYSTNGEYVIIVKGVEHCELFLDNNTTDHVVVKALTEVLVKSDTLIDDEFTEVELSHGSCVEFKYVGGSWYVLSSDGLKNS